MKNLICFCIRRPVMVIMIMAAIFMGGFLSFFLMPLDKLPEILLPQVTIETLYPGMNATDIRSAVTIPMEDAMSPVKGLEGIRSVSRDGVSLINLSFRWGTDPSYAAALVREAVDRVYPGLPQGVNKPSVISGNTADEPHIILAIRSVNGDNSFARNIAEYEMKARLRRLDGVGAVILRGGETQEARIKLNPERIVSRGYNGYDFAYLIAPEIADIPAGNAREGDLELTVVSQGRPQSMEELSALILPTADSPLVLADYGIIISETATQKSFFLYQDKEQTALEIYRRPGADPVKLSREIKKVLTQSAADFSRDIELSIVWDSSDSILDSIKNLAISAIIAAIAVAFILAFFIRNFRSSFFAALAIPVSAAAAVILLKLCGRSLNSMSLAGLAMGIGLVSDASVIVLDLFYRRLSAGEKLVPLSLGSLTSSVSASSFAGTITTIVVFLPIVFLPGPLGVLFGDLSLSLIASVVMGWIYAQFFLPALYLFSSRKKAVQSSYRQNSDSVSNSFERFYSPLLLTTLRRPIPLIAGAFVFSMIGILLLVGRPAQFFVFEEVREIEIIIDFPSGTKPEIISAEGIRFSTFLSGIKNISSFYGSIGTEDEDLNPRTDPDYRRERLLFRCFLDKGIKRETVRKEIQDILSQYDYPGVQLYTGYPLDKTTKLLGLSSSFTLLIKGELNEVESNSEKTAKAVRAALGQLLDGISIRPSGTRPELRLIPDRQAAAILGISAAKLADAVYTVTEGIVAGTMEIDGRPMDIRVMGNIPLNTQYLETLPLVFTANQDRNLSPIFLSSLGKVERRETKAALIRQDRSDAVYLDLIPVPGKEKELSSFLNKNVGTYIRTDESVFSRYRLILIGTLVLVIVLLYLTMAAQFESFKLPLIIMLSIPFGLAGAGPLLSFFGMGLDSGSVLGLIVLFGLAVNNGIILYEASLENIGKGFKPALAVYKGSLERFRPVLISALTTVFGLIPLLLSPGPSQRSMALAMLGGLTISTLLTIFALPPVFIILLKSRRAE
ncbi:MAG: efflux RND transporter permease subunit [Treponema sp.]|nr:efflux RND transporter permease subunit [Treponema sp.]